MNNDQNEIGHEDAELSEWRSEWQTLGGQADLAAELVVRAAKDGQKMRRAAAMEVLAVLCSSSVCLWLVVRSHGSLQVAVMVAIVLLFNDGWLTHFFTSRAQLFRSSGEGLDPFVELARKRLAAELRWARFTRKWMAALVIPLVPWAIWMFAAHRDVYLAAPWRAVVGFGGAAAIFIGVLAWTFRKERKLQGESDRFERQLADARLA